MLELKIEELRKRVRPVKRWIDVVKEDMEKRGVVQGIERFGGER